MSERAAAGKEMESIDAGVPNIDYRCFENIDDIDVNIDALKTSMVSSVLNKVKWNLVSLYFD